jgi:hypothetical protein
MTLISQAELPERQRQELSSAIRTVARVLGGEPANIVADPAALRRRLETIAPEAQGISRGRLANVRSLLHKGLALMRPMMPGRSVQPILPEWEVVAAKLAFNLRVRLLPMLRFLSERRKKPSDVTLGDLEAYREAILNNRLRRRPEKTWDGLTWAWNACQRNVEGWPAIAIERASRRKIYVMPWSTFPAPFKQDVDRFLDRLAGRDLSDDGPTRPARNATLQKRQYQLRIAGSALVHRGQDAQTIRSIADLLSFERYQEILRFFLDRHGGQTSPQIGQLAAALKDIARHWVKVDAATLERFKRIAARLAIPRRGMTTKNRERLRPFDNAETVAVFLGLPKRIRREVEANKHNPLRNAVLAQMAAAIALLQAAPIRLKNLTHLDVEANLIGRGRKLYLVRASQITSYPCATDF